MDGGGGVSGVSRFCRVRSRELWFRLKVPDCGFANRYGSTKKV